MFFAKPWLDALIVLFVVLLFFGPKRLPTLGRSLGEGMREFKDSITGKSGAEDDERLAVPEASSQPVPAAPPEPRATAPTAPPEGTPAQAPPPVASSERRS
jgi:sec-independent protein translocase protein TatA